VPRYALRLAYDGSGFSGWWRQPGRRSVAGDLDAACARLGEPAAAAVGASRTDAGVHARGQVAHLDLLRPRSPADLWRGLNAQLPADIACAAVAAVAPDWHACHRATGKTYRYCIDNGACADPFTAKTTWRPPFRLDLAALQAAAAVIPGRRDWRGFIRRGEHRDNLERTIDTVTWHAEATHLVATVGGDGFTYHLVRSLVGAMVAVATGTCHAGDLARALAGEDTPAGKQQAPARGLCLMQVRYAPEPEWTTGSAEALLQSEG